MRIEIVKMRIRTLLYRQSEPWLATGSTEGKRMRRITLCSFLKARNKG